VRVASLALLLRDARHPLGGLVGFGQLLGGVAVGLPMLLHLRGARVERAHGVEERRVLRLLGRRTVVTERVLDVLPVHLEHGDLVLAGRVVRVAPVQVFLDVPRLGVAEREPFYP
jgi:hypothetical protein